MIIFTSPPLFLFFFLLALTSALPIAYHVRNAPQEYLSPAFNLSTPPESVRTIRTQLASLVKSLKPASTFQCHKPNEHTTDTLSSLVEAIDNIVDGYRDKLFKDKAPPPQIYELCKGEWGREEEREWRPSIYFRRMTTRQLRKIEELVKNSILPRLTGVNVKRAEGDGLVVYIVETGA